MEGAFDQQAKPRVKNLSCESCGTNNWTLVENSDGKSCQFVRLYAQATAGRPAI